MKLSTNSAVAVMLGLSILFIAFVGVSVQLSANDITKELKLVHVIMRHGVRTPVDTYPNDPHINEDLYPTGWGQLTNDGKLRLYHVGKFLRERYGSFLTGHYSPSEYYAQSTDVDRTKASLQLVNAGLWPPEPEQKWGPLDWQPIPIHSEPLDQDKLLLVRVPCPQYDIELNKVKQTIEIQEKLLSYEELCLNLTELTGKQVRDFDDIQDVYSTLRAEEETKLELPEWTQDYYPDKMLEPTAFSFILNVYNDKLKRLKGGLLLKKLIADWKSKLEGTLKEKAFLYGGHDSTVVNIMQSLNLWDSQIPDYNITVLLELSRERITGQDGVEVFLRNSSSPKPFLLTIPGCESFCPLEKLILLTKNVVPVNWEQECLSDDPSYVPTPPKGP